MITNYSLDPDPDRDHEPDRKYRKNGHKGSYIIHHTASAQQFIPSELRFRSVNSEALTFFVKLFVCHATKVSFIPCVSNFIVWVSDYLTHFSSGS